VTEAFAFGDVPRLTAALRRGDEAAFAWLHDAWSGRINRYCFALAAGDEPFAREIAQAAWLRSRGTFASSAMSRRFGTGSPAPRHAATDLRRTGGRYFRDAPPLCGMVAAPADDTDADRSLLAALEAALGKLGTDERALIEGRYFAANRWKPSAHARRFPCARSRAGSPGCAPACANSSPKNSNHNPMKPNQTKLRALLEDVLPASGEDLGPSRAQVLDMLHRERARRRLARRHRVGGDPRVAAVPLLWKNHHTSRTTVAVAARKPARITIEHVNDEQLLSCSTAHRPLGGVAEWGSHAARRPD